MARFMSLDPEEMTTTDLRNVAVSTGIARDVFMDLRDGRRNGVEIDARQQTVRMSPEQAAETVALLRDARAQEADKADKDGGITST